MPVYEWPQIIREDESKRSRKRGIHVEGHGNEREMGIRMVELFRENPLTRRELKYAEAKVRTITGKQVTIRCKLGIYASIENRQVFALNPLRVLSIPPSIPKAEGDGSDRLGISGKNRFIAVRRDNVSEET